MVEMDTSDTACLIASCLQGDEASIERLVLDHQPGVYRLALSILDDPADAGEAAQEALIAALARLDSYRGDSAFTTWLYTITVNVSRRRLRKRQALARLKHNLQALLRVHAGSAKSIEERVIQDETEALLWQALQGLGEKHRLPMILRYYLDLPVEEIAHILGIRQGTVHSRLFTARERLRTALKEATVDKIGSQP
jgi:RNA polymerase sigma-70 factor (ECF subfamily)